MDNPTASRRQVTHPLWSTKYVIAAPHASVIAWQMDPLAVKPTDEMLDVSKRLPTTLTAPAVAANMPFMELRAFCPICIRPGSRKKRNDQTKILMMKSKKKSECATPRSLAAFAQRRKTAHPRGATQAIAKLDAEDLGVHQATFCEPELAGYIWSTGQLLTTLAALSAALLFDCRPATPRIEAFIFIMRSFIVFC
mmetsp:Transcript_43764/g.80194  ORF Transcript_43764/g.80194 Transcript_43764/m.80194 type:complete len:195 (+) Transcript_43764:378-962(+)